MQDVHPSDRFGIADLAQINLRSVSDTSILGRPGTASEDMVLPFRVIEDVLLLGLLLGGLERMFARLLEIAKNNDTPPDKIGRLFRMLAAMEAVSLRASQLLNAEAFPQAGIGLLKAWHLSSGISHGSFCLF